MATQEKLVKSLDALKHLISVNLSTDASIRRKEKIQHCNFIAEAISTSTIKIAPNFSQLLSLTFEILLKLCDDQESDIRMIADECLNKIIRAMNNGNIGKVQIELHKEMKKNGAARSLKAALWRFSQLAYLIRPHKGKPYVINILPCIIRISERKEEFLHETLASSLPKIMQTLGCFTTDNDIKTLLKAFLSNISSTSTVIRRTTASCILTVCLNCKKPYVFLAYVLNNLLDLLVPVEENNCNSLILGVLGGLKAILPHIKNSERQEIQGSFGMRKQINEVPIAVDKFLQIYELSLCYLLYTDHNVVNAALETLNVLLLNCQPEFKSELLSPNGMKSLLENVNINKSSPRQMSLASTQHSEENLLLDSELTESIRTDIEKWIDESKLSVINVNYVTDSEKSSSNSDANKSDTSFEQIDTSEYSNISIGNIADNYAESVKSECINDSLEKFVLSENSSELSYQHVEEKSSTTTVTEFFSIDIDIGDFKDKNIPLIYCTRLIVKAFLLTGQPNTIIPDKNVRVSVKNLALTCLSTILQIYPKVFLLYLDRNCSNYNGAKDNKLKQQISDILLFENHSDPQLRGIVRILIASFLKSVIIENEGNYCEWVDKYCEVDCDDVFLIQKLVNVITTGLEDESSNCTRQSLIALNICLKYILESQNSLVLIPVLNILPLIAKNPYWLIKVKLLEIVSDIQYMTVHHILGNQEFQNKVIYNILFYLLKDDDQRVRNICSIAIVKIIPILYFESNTPNQNTVTNKAIYYKDLYFHNVFSTEIETNITANKFVSNMLFPYNASNNVENTVIDFSLARIISKLNQFLLTSKSKHFIHGCIETLCLLSCKYPTTLYKSSWNCFRNFKVQQENIIFQRSNSVVSNSLPVNELSISSSNDLFNISIGFFMHVIAYDLNCHSNLLKFTGNIFAGVCVQNLQLITDINIETQKPLWDMFTDKNLQELSEKFLNHVVKMLNIFSHIIDEVIPVIVHVKPALPTLPAASSLSPLKRRKSDLDKSKLLSPGKATEKEDKNEKRNDNIKSNAMGYFANIPHYMKIYDLLRTAYLNYKVTLDIEASENFLGLLSRTLCTLSQILEVATLTETGRISEEILSYLRSTFHLEPTATVQCVHQLLKSLFGTNLTLNTDVLNFLHKDEHEIQDMKQGFYYNMSQKPYNDISQCINFLTQTNKVDCIGDNTVMGYLHRKEIKKPITKGTDKILANYIRIFEPMVIKSLKHYTITSNVRLQCKVLELLSQLVLLRVNYCLLDSEQIFIGFVLKQFDFIEEGQVQLVEELIPKIFQFLVHLSYGKQHSKSIISVPKVIQLCDGLMASGQTPLTHCVPALQPIVEDIFLMRNKSNTSDLKELETTREVLLSMLLRMLEYNQVIDLLVLILNECKYCDNQEKWSRWSKQIFDVFLTMLKHNKIRLNNRQCISSVIRLIWVLNPSVLKPLNEILITLFQESPCQNDSVNTISHWLGKNVILLLILTQTKEEILLMKIIECLKDFSPRSIFENVVITPDPLNVTNTSTYFERMSPEAIFVKLIFRIIDVTSHKCVELAKSEEDHFLVEQLTHFLMVCLYIFQSGSHCRIANLAIKLSEDESKHKDKIVLDVINTNFLKLSMFFPILTFKWCYFLTVLNYNNRKFWASILKINETYGIIKHIKESSVNNEPHCINLEIVRTGGTIAFCEYLTENISDAEQLTWFLINNIELIIELCEEPPVNDFIATIHRNPAASVLIIQAISTKCLENTEPTFVTKLLKCIETVHSSQTGALINLLITRLLDVRQLAISRLVASLASRKIEFLLTLSMEEVNSQLTKEDLMHIIDILLSLKLAKKNETLVSLLNKLSTQFYDLSPLELDQRRAINPEYIKKLLINKNWYLTQVKTKCHLSSCGPEIAELLNCLDYDDIVNIMSGKDFNRLILKDCIIFCISHMESNGTKDEQPLLKASIFILLRDVMYVRTLLPKPHQVFRVDGRDQTQSEQKYSHRLGELFNDDMFLKYLNSLVPPVTCYIESLSIFPYLTVPDSNLEDLLKFSILCLESVNYLISVKTCNISINFIDRALNCADIILKENCLNSILALETHISWLCSAVNSIYKLVSYVLLNFEPLPSLPKNSLKSTLQNFETMSAGQACYQLSILVLWIEKNKKSSVINIPNFMYKTIMSIVISLSRLPLVNSYVLTPPSAWKNGWAVELTGPYSTHVPPLPIYYLQEIEILEEFIYRITLLGWTSRQQFEETWMCLLSVLSYVPSETSVSDEINAQSHATSLAVRAITSLLVLTLYDPCPGNRNNSKLIHVSRDSVIDDNSASVRKLKSIQDNFQRKFAETSKSIQSNETVINVFHKSNLEKYNKIYTCGQVSVEYLLISSKIVDIVDDHSVAVKLFRRREEILNDSGLDLNSCIQFLLDLYTQWINGHWFLGINGLTLLNTSDVSIQIESFSKMTTQLRILNEVVKSILIISDLFMEKSQYMWMLESCLDLSRTHIIEDDVIHQYLIISVCKAAAVITPDMETYETVKKLLTQGLKSAFLSARIGSLHGMLYILQGCIIGNTIIGGVSEEMQMFLPIAVEYVQCHIGSNNGVLNQSQDHNLLLWALSFYLIENVNENHIDPEFTTMVVQTAIKILSLPKLIIAVHNSVMKGLERLVIKKCLPEKLCDQIMKISLDKMRDSNPVYALPAIQLLISCMYTECAEQLESTEKSSGIVQSNPDNLVQTIEKVSAIFDRIKKGYPFEVEVLCYILPNILNDFFPPSDILTKVVGEFLSPQQRHPKLLSRVVFKVFESAIQQSQLSLLQDWVVFSLSNFTQSFSIGMATWCLTCFFISASTNKWIRSLFPYVQSRIGRYEYEDRKMLCIAGSDFYKNLTNDTQKKTFVDTFQKVKDQVDMPFNDLLASL